MDNYILPANILSIGYNPENGQSFFDLLTEYCYWVREYFFSLTHIYMGGTPVDENKMIKHFSSLNTYGIPGNLIFNNRNNNDDDFKRLIPIIRDIINLKSVTFLNPKLCKECKELYPDLETHVSIRYFDYNYQTNQELTPNILLDRLIEDGTIQYVDVINVSGTYSYADKEFNEKCHANNVKTKFLLNEGCIVGRSLAFNKLFPKGEEIKEMCFKSLHPDDASEYACRKLFKYHPWMVLSGNNIFKEMLPLTNYDIIKVSARQCKLDRLKILLLYITSTDNTNIIEGNKIKDYNAFLEYCKYKSEHCICDCSRCMKCKEFYERIF